MPAPELRIGHGYDLHRLEPLAPTGAGRPFILAGVRFAHDLGPVGHSDGDALYHAVTDALMGAIGGPDIGTMFPDDDPRHEGRDSAQFVAGAMEHVRAAGYHVVNLDATIVCERPKLKAHHESMRANLARLLGCPSACVNTKGKTHEGVDAIGAGRAVEVHALVLLAREAGA